MSGQDGVTEAESKLNRLWLRIIVIGILFLMLTANDPAQSTVQAQTQESLITVQTDKESYDFHYPNPAIVVISGNVSKDILREGEKVVIQVLNPMGARYRVDFVNVSASDGSYQYPMPIGGSIAGISGEYTVLATYSGNYQSETTFQYDTHSEAIEYTCMMSLCTYEITISNVTHIINYRMSGTIGNVTADIESKTLILNVTTGRGQGILRLALPKDLIKAEDEQGDDAFVVIVNGKETVFEEITEAEQYYSYLGVDQNPENYRLLSLTFEGVVKQVKIVGTWIAPEFDLPLVIGVMIVSIVGTVVWSRLWYRQKRI